MTNKIFNIKKEIEKLYNNKNKLKWDITKINLIITICSLTSLLILNKYINLEQLLITIPLTGIIGTSLSLIINNKRRKEKNQIKQNILYKKQQLDNEIKQEIKIKELNSVKQINHLIEYDNLEQFVLNNKLQQDYHRNIKKIKKRVKTKK